MMLLHSYKRRSDSQNDSQSDSQNDSQNDSCYANRKVQDGILRKAAYLIMVV